MTIFRDQWLVAPKQQRHLEKLASRSGVIHYYIERRPFHGILETEYGNTFTYQVKGAAQNGDIRNWIKTLIEHLDASLDVDFKEVKKSSKSQLRFLAAKHVSQPWSRDTTGESIWNPSGGMASSGLATVLVKKQKQPTDQMATITHELGHALGLKHPKQKPYSSEFSTASTIMSYNEAKHSDFIYKDFTVNDLNALASLWGVETDQSLPLTTRVPFPTDEDCDSLDFKNDLFITTKLPVEFSTKADDYLIANELNVNLYGAGGDDTMIGSEGRDTLGGGPGDDLLDGGPGRDLLYGHEGKDRFVITEGEGIDEIHFFEQGLDLIHVNHDGGKLLLSEAKGGFMVSLDAIPIAMIKNIEFSYGLCAGDLAVIGNQFIA